MKILITGASGFLGRYLLDDLCVHNEVVCLGRRPGITLKGRSVPTIIHDFRTGTVPSGLPPRVDVVIHLAAMVGQVDTSLISEQRMINVIFTQALLEYAKSAGATCFLYASSGGVYGYRSGMHREVDTPSPRDAYNLTKLQAEDIARSYSPHFRVPILRLYYLYGPGQERTRLVSSLAHRIRDGIPLHLQYGGSMKLNPTYISDAVTACNHIISSDHHGPVNVAGPEIVSLKELCNMIGVALRITPLFETRPDECNTNTTEHMMGDISLLTRIQGHSPRVHLTEGLIYTLQNFAATP